MTHKIEFKEFEERIKKIARKIIRNKQIENIYAIKPTGTIPAVRLSFLTGLPLTEYPNPERSVIIDSVFENYEILNQFKEYKHMIVIVDKEDEEIKEEVKFWWEFE